MKVHVPVDIRYGTEVFFAVKAAKCSSTISQNDRTTGILSLDWSPNYVQPKLSEGTQNTGCNAYSVHRNGV